MMEALQIPTEFTNIGTQRIYMNSTQRVRSTTGVTNNIKLALASGKDALLVHSSSTYIVLEGVLPHAENREHIIMSMSLTTELQ